MERPVGPGGSESSAENEGTDEWQKEHSATLNEEPGHDIARIARSLGFSQKEVCEIERLYLSSPNGPLK